MPGVTAGVYTGSLTAGTEVSSTFEGRHVTVYENELIHPYIADGLVNKGDPVVLCDAGVSTTYGHAVGVAFNSATASTDLIAIDTEGIWNLTVYAEDDNGNAAIEIGDPLYIRAGALPGAADADGTGDAEISKIVDPATQVPFGYALGSVVAGGSGVIAVKVHWDPSEHWLQDDAILYFGDDKDVYVDWDGTRLHMQGLAAETIFQMGSGDHAFQLKVHARNTTLGNAIEVRARTVADDPTLNAIDSICYLRPATGLTDGYHASAGFFQTRLDATYDMTDGYLHGILVEVANQGTINGAGVIAAAINGVVPDVGGVFTSLNVITPLWLDWKMTETISSGIATLAFLTNNGTTALDSILRINAGSNTTNLFTLDEAGGMVSAEVTADYTFTTYVKIKVEINSVTYYLIADRT